MISQVNLTLLDLSSYSLTLTKNSFKSLKYYTDAESITIDNPASDKIETEIDNENKTIKISSLNEYIESELTIRATASDKTENSKKLKVIIKEWVKPEFLNNYPSEKEIKAKYNSEQWLKEFKPILDEYIQDYNSAKPLDIVTFFSFKYKEQIITQVLIGIKHGKIKREIIDECNRTIIQESFLPLLISEIQLHDKFYYLREYCDIISINSMYKKDWDYVFKV